MMKKFFVTTPIYYVNGDPHVGTIYTTVAADIIARYMRFNNRDVFFLTGTDEHGEKVQQAAEKKGMTPQEYVDMMSARFKEAFKKMNISYDRFIRTTDEDHIKTATEFYKKVYDNGDIYKGEYEGWYCVSCETFWTEKDLKEGRCPDCGKEVKKIKEESYFFRQSKYQKRIIEHIKNNPEFIEPESRRNEILAFLKKPLKDLSISRSTFKWGIPLPNDSKHIMYVWFDALTNYLTACKYPSKEYKNMWPADIHLMGKEITRFHCITWPAMLMSAGVELPKKIFGHGWWTVEGEKMSKSKGNVIYPNELCEKYNLSVDAIRYVMFKQMPFGNDGDFSEKIFVDRVNNELAAELGNLIMRAVVMVKRYSKGVVPKGKAYEEIVKLTKDVVDKYKKSMEKLDYYNALTITFDYIHKINKFISEEQPWKMDDKTKLNNFIYTLTQTINTISGLIYPFMPDTSDKIDEQIGTKRSYNLELNNVKEGTKIKQGRALFPKVEYKKEEGLITIDEFRKAKMRTGTIVSVEEFNDRIYKLKVMADKERTVLAGLRKFYKKEELLNKKVIIVINLKPKVIDGVKSEGMLLAAEKKGIVSLLMPDKEIKNNAKVF